MDASAHFRGKRITVMGLGLLGRGVGDARYLAECGAEIIVTDLKTREQLAESVAQLESFPNITFVLGEHRLEDFANRDLILKAAGVPLDSLYIAEAKKNKIPIRMSADLFAEISGIHVIGVTGTRGKSTVTHMLYAILKETKKPVLLGGNVLGVSTLALLSEVTPEHTAILELDSWQCQGWGEMKMSPHIAVFTTLFPDHLNYYKDNLDAYLTDKANIFLYQKPEDILILGKQCAAIIIEKYGDKIKSKTVVADELKLPDTWALKIPGLHNRYNAALALAAARALGISDDISRTVLESFTGVPGRLELIAEKNGVKIYNDTTATTPEATLAGISSLSDVGRTTSHIILIMGGADKGLDMSALIAKLANVKKIILLAGTGTERIVGSLQETENIGPYSSLEDAVTDAFAHAEPGDTILFSPAFASFGMFKNEYDRGDQFNALIKELAS
ncbi:MAG: UDP-N-acetylmuramoyl-L-alanine--D-glutamate ligase [Candidatus Kaiserbacteria bacterium]|nr:UDP-N-acetylmuramoyl-L-alanine--D-glutamate ligase [Candidatus Kaiserbacteria bacterium]